MKMVQLTAIAGFSASILAGLAFTLPASAQEAVVSGQFELPYGMGFGQESRAYEPGTRDANGNRYIVDGRIIYGDSYSSLNGGLNTQWGSTSGSGMLGHSQAIGNQLNVITNGSYNTIIIDNTQINNGDQNAVLNGELNLNE